MSDVSVNINRHIHIRLLVILKFNAVGIAIIPQRNDFSINELPSVGLDLVAHLETKFTRHEARLEAMYWDKRQGSELVMVANEIQMPSYTHPLP